MGRYDGCAGEHPPMSPEGSDLLGSDEPPVESRRYGLRLAGNQRHLVLVKTTAMRAPALISVVAFGCVACGSPASTPSRTAPTPSPSVATPSPPPVALSAESCGGITHDADGNASPVLCPDGHPNAAADTYFRDQSPALTVLELGPTATASQVLAAMCVDVNQAHMTYPIETTVEELAQVENGWYFAGWTASDPDHYLVSGGCNP
jgi:hypothetical protein